MVEVSCSLMDRAESLMLERFVEEGVFGSKVQEVNLPRMLNVREELLPKLVGSIIRYLSELL